MKSGKIFSIFMLLVFVSIPIASYAGTLEDGTSAMEKGDYQTAYKLLYPLAEQGDATAQDSIGSMYCEGLGVEKDEAQAATWFEKAADQGYAKAENAYGAMLVNGEGVAQDEQKGMSYILKAARQGLEVAQRNYYQLNLEEAKNSNYAALHNVGLMCLRGWGGNNDAHDCIKILEAAAQNGYMKSANVLSKIYETGKFGIEKDAEKAAFWKNFEENPPQAEAPAAN